MNKKTQTILSFLLLVVILGGGFWYFHSKKQSSQKVAQKAIDYLNNQLSTKGMTASLIDTTERENVIEMNFKVGQQEYTSYVTKNGDLFFVEGINLNKKLKKTNNKNSQESGTGTDEEISKKETPNVGLFVMSFCPYGNKAENTMKPVYDLLKDDVNFDVHYIVRTKGDKIQSLHGQKEVNQNMREVCVKKNYGMDQYWDFTTYVNDNCGSDGSCWEKAANKIGISSQEIQSCVDESGLGYMKENAQLSNEAGASGSPTLFVNGTKTKEVYQYGDSEAYKQVVCSAFTEDAKPESCSQVLSSGDSSSPSGGGCGG